MALAATELISGGFVRDADGRLAVLTDTANTTSGAAGYPPGATPITAASGNKAAATANVSLPASSTQFTYITGFEVTGAGATAASVITITVTGVVTGTLTYVLTIPAGVTTAVSPLIVQFPVPIPSSAVNTAIVVNVPSFGSGNTNAATVAHGFQL